MLRLPARRSARRPAALLLAAGLLVPSLAACGSEDDGSGDGADGGSAAALEAVTVEGEVGEAADVTFDGAVEVDETVSEVLVEGEGEELAAGDDVLAHIYAGNGTTEEQALTTYEGDQPQIVPVAGEGFLPALTDSLEGVTVGSRVVVAATPEDAFGPQGNPQLGIGTADTVVFVVDVLQSPLSGPEGEEVEPEGPVPTLETGEGTDVTGLSFPEGLEASGEVQKTVLVEGEGEEVTAEDTVIVDYLGQVLGQDAPFDESYSRLPTALPVANFVEGWQQALPGTTVGSRVVLEVPPAQGYGKQGNPQAGIGGKDTMFFVVDVLGVR